MSVIVTGMDMPEKCADCDFCHGHICKLTGVDIVTKSKRNCPLKSVEDLLTEISAWAIRYPLKKDEAYNQGLQTAIEIIKEYCERGNENADSD